MSQTYRSATEDILKDVRIKTVWTDTPTNPYETMPRITVPGCLEFAGLTKQFERLSPAGLMVYRGELYGTRVDDLFPDKTDAERISALERCNPRILGLATELLYYYHNGVGYLEGKEPMWESNALFAIGLLPTTDEYRIFSSGFLAEVDGFFRNKDLRKKLELEQRALEEIAASLRR